ncbi:MAG: NAD-dependent epimerase/dehydratase family protein, partial [Deltaproteobacteria bacterium]
MKIKAVCAGHENMKIFVIGGSGFIGHALINGLKAEGHQITALLRRGNKQKESDRSVRYVAGDPMEPGRWQDIMMEHDIVINLAGAAIFRRWSDEIKAEILDSRIVTTRHIVETIRKAQKRNIQFFNASGIGYYGYCGDEIIDEGALHGDTFLSRVALDWESEAGKAEETGVRVVLCRFGIVLGKSGGALRKISALANLHLGGMWGSGKQWFSWIHEKDVVNTFRFLLE